MSSKKAQKKEWVVFRGINSTMLLKYKVLKYEYKAAAGGAG